MGFEIRSVEDDELVEWMSVVGTAFFSRSAPEEMAAFRRPTVDLSRMWGAYDDGHVVGTLRTFPSELTVPGGGTPMIDAVSGVTVLPTHRRQGALTGTMTAALTAAVERGDALSYLIAARWRIYGRYGFGAATERARYSVATGHSEFRRGLVDDGRVRIVAAAEARLLAAPVLDRWRSSRPGAIARAPQSWDEQFGLRVRPGGDEWKGRCAVHFDGHGVPDGYLRWHADDTWDGMEPQVTVIVDDLIAATPEAYCALWGTVLAMDNVVTVTAEDRPVDEPLGWYLLDGRAVRQRDRSDHAWLRVLDVAAALEARRYAATDRVVLEVIDPLGFATGRFALDGGPDGATCTRTDASPDLTLPVTTLGSAYLGGYRLRTLAAAGLLSEHTAGAVARADAMFTGHPAPWCNTEF